MVKLRGSPSEASHHRACNLAERDVLLRKIMPWTPSRLEDSKKLIGNVVEIRMNGNPVGPNSGSSHAEFLGIMA